VIDICGDDGHSIYSREVFTLLPDSFIKPFFKSFRGNINRTDGTPTESLEGIYGLELLYSVAMYIGADIAVAHTKIGRGFQATELTKALKARLELMVD